MCLYVLREKCTGVQKNSAFGALCEASGAFRICGANISGRRYFARCAEMNFMEKGPAEKQVLFLKTNPNFNTNAPPFEIRGCKVILGGAFLSKGGAKLSTIHTLDIIKFYSIIKFIGITKYYKLL